MVKPAFSKTGETSVEPPMCSLLIPSVLVTSNHQCRHHCVNTAWTYAADMFRNWKRGVERGAQSRYIPCCVFDCTVYKPSFILRPGTTRSQTTPVDLSWVEITTSGSLSQNDKHPKFHRRLNRRLMAFNLFTAALRFRKSPLFHL